MIIAIVLVVAILVTLAIVFLNKDKELPENNVDYNFYIPEFMDTQEKASLSLPEDSKIQVLKRNDNGEVSVYKVIREDIDVEYNIEALHQPIR